MRKKDDTLIATARRWLYAPQPIERLVLLRVLAPLAMLGFMSSRVVYADTWIGDAGFTVPDLGGDWRQPMYIPPLPVGAAWFMAGVLVLSGLATVVGFYTPWAAGIFAFTLAYVALADRLAAFTVSKLSPVVALTLCVSAAGARYSFDAWLATKTKGTRQPEKAPLPSLASGAPIRFIQVLLPTFYCSSGICKVNGEWLSRFDVLWTHLHDSYQTPISYWLANNLPAGSWSLMQLSTLVFEVGAPLWFALPSTRVIALIYGIVLHVLIGLMFGPVKWFALLMIALLLSAYLPEPWLRKLFAFRLFKGTPGRAEVG